MKATRNTPQLSARCHKDHDKSVSGSAEAHDDGQQNSAPPSPPAMGKDVAAESTGDDAARALQWGYSLVS